MKTGNTKAVKNGNERTYMGVNVILTFETPDGRGERQEFFDLSIPVGEREKSADEFINNKLFKRIVKKCHLLNRDPRDLIKISTASAWSVFERKTGLPSLGSLGHSCKWYFGKGRNDLDLWEIYLSAQYGFGVHADMSRENRLNAEQALALQQIADEVIQGNFKEVQYVS